MRVDFSKPQDVAAIVAVATVLAKSLWGGLTQIWHRLSERIYAKVHSRSLDLGPFEGVPRGARLRCLVVRYGTDKYLQHLAPAQDKFEGRLRNKVREVAMTGREGAAYSFMARIPVHSRLGTQFKFFFEANSLEDAELIASNTNFMAPYIARTAVPIKVWFLVQAFETAETVEGFKNNFWPAI